MNNFKIIGLSLASLFVPVSNCENQNTANEQQPKLQIENLKSTDSIVANPQVKPASAYDIPVVRIYNDTVTQGETPVVTLKSKFRQLKKPYCQYLDSEGKVVKLPMYQNNDSIYSALIGTNPYTKTGLHKVVISDGENFSQTDSVYVKNAKFASQRPKFSAAKSNLHIPSEDAIEINKILNSVSDLNYFDLPPYNLPTKGILTTEYGAMRPGFHNGLDISAPEGKDVQTVLSGKVLWAKEDPMNGKMVIVEHGENLKTCYLHMSEIGVKQGDIISKNQVIGKVGTTGHSTGPHLHFEMVISNGNGHTAINPLQFFDNKSIIKSPQLKERLIKAKATESVDSVKKIPKYFETEFKKANLYELEKMPIPKFKMPAPPEISKMLKFIARHL